MNYFVVRGSEQYGPYTLADLQRYLAQGSILPTDMAKSEGMNELRPVRDIVGNIPVQPQQQPPSYGSVPGYVAPSPAGAPAQYAGAPGTPVPPNLHWALVLLISMVTCGIFAVVWMFVEASFVKKIRPDSNALIFYAIGIGVEFAGAFASGISPNMQALGSLITLGGAALLIGGHFSMKASLEEYYNSVEPVNLQLSGVMVFFFNMLYFQYHFSRIRNWKVTGVLA